MFGVLLVLLLALLGRLFDLQYLRYDVYRHKALDQHKSVQRVAARRGRIFDRNGSVFAISTTKPALWADGGEVTNAARTAAKIEELTGISAAEVLPKISDPKRRYVVLSKEMSDVQATLLRPAMRKRELRGIYLMDVNRRFYPKGQLLGNVIGLCNAEHQGAEGLERQANRFLTGEDGYQILKRDNKRRTFFSFDQEYVHQQLVARDGYDVHLTIDEYVQHIAEEAVQQTVERFKPQRAMALVMQPRTGAILAMALWPSFDPNDQGSYVPGSFRNYATSEIYEPGSTLKVVIGSIALNEGLVSLDERVHCENGHWQVTRAHAIKDDHVVPGDLSFREIIQHSSNIGVAKVAQRIAPEVLYAYLTNFGFGHPTGLQLIPPESPGILRPVAQWSKYSMFSIPIGHEIGVTAMQMLTAVSVIANGGTRVRPTFVQKIVNTDGMMPPEARTFNYFEPLDLARNVISAAAAAQITDAMLTVTDREGTGYLAGIPGYSVAGKTGTSQKYIPGKGYSKREYTASFVGFVPAKDPAISAIIIVDSPAGEYYGGLVAAPAFRSICEKTLAYLGVAKDRVDAPLPENMAAEPAQHTARTQL